MYQGMLTLKLIFTQLDYTYTRSRTDSESDVFSTYAGTTDCPYAAYANLTSRPNPYLRSGCHGQDSVLLYYALICNSILIFMMMCFKFMIKD